MLMWNKTVLAVMLQWDYGQASRGISIEKSSFFFAMQQLVQRVEPFWYDEYLDNTSPLQELVVARARELQPDLIFFIPYTDQFTVETLDSLKIISPTYCWFGDDQWRFESFTARYASHFTHVSTTDPWSIPKYRAMGIDPILTQWAGQPFSEELGALADEQLFAHDVSFVGARTNYRAWFVQQLAKRGIHVTCFGAGWPNGRVDNTTMERIFRTSRINLNISNSVSRDVRFVMSSPRSLLHYLRSPKRVEQMKARNFEISLAGGFQLTNYVPCLERYLAIGDEIALYSTPEECAGQISYYLAESAERCRMAARGHARVLNEHTYRHRVEHILRHVWGEADNPILGSPQRDRIRQ
jgi:spore maturation protein CgeB